MSVAVASSNTLLGPLAASAGVRAMGGRESMSAAPPAASTGRVRHTHHAASAQRLRLRNPGPPYQTLECPASNARFSRSCSLSPQALPTSPYASLPSRKTRLPLLPTPLAAPHADDGCSGPAPPPAPSSLHSRAFLSVGALPPVVCKAGHHVLSTDQIPVPLLSSSQHLALGTQSREMHAADWNQHLQSLAEG